MEIVCKIFDCRIENFSSEFLNTDDLMFQSKKKRLEDRGYTGKQLRDRPSTYIFTRPNAVWLELVSYADTKKAIGEFDLHNLILNYYHMERLSKNKVNEFVKGVNSGLIQLLFNGRSFRIGNK